MSEDFKIIKAYPFNGRDSFETNPDYFKVKSNLEIPEHRIILIAPYYKPKSFTLNFYKVYEEYNSNGVNNMIINGANYDALLDISKEPAIIANIDINLFKEFVDGVIQIYNEPEKLNNNSCNQIKNNIDNHNINRARFNQCICDFQRLFPGIRLRNNQF